MHQNATVSHTQCIVIMSFLVMSHLDVWSVAFLAARYHFSWGQHQAATAMI